MVVGEFFTAATAGTAGRTVSTDNTAKIGIVDTARNFLDMDVFFENIFIFFLLASSRSMSHDYLSLLWKIFGQELANRS